MRRGRSLRDKCQLQVVDDPVHNGIVGEESDDLHVSSALSTNQRIDLVTFLIISAQPLEGMQEESSSMIGG